MNLYRSTPQSQRELMGTEKIHWKNIHKRGDPMWFDMTETQKSTETESLYSRAQNPTQTQAHAYQYRPKPTTIRALMKACNIKRRRLKSNATRNGSTRTRVIISSRDRGRERKRVRENVLNGFSSSLSFVLLPPPPSSLSSNATIVRPFLALNSYSVGFSCVFLNVFVWTCFNK